MAHWFKFYGPEYLSDQKFLGMDGSSRSCWLTLLCFASDHGGEIEYLSEEHLMVMSGITIGSQEWHKATGILKRFEDKGMIQIEGNVIRVCNWSKRQTLTPYERVKRHRDKLKNDNEMITTEKNRIDKNREEKSDKPHASIKYFSEIPDTDLKELTGKYEASSMQVKRKAEELKNYCLAKGKVYKNYRAFLENALQKDFGRRIVRKAPEIIEKPNLSDEEQSRIDSLKSEIGAKFKFQNV